MYTCRKLQKKEHKRLFPFLLDLLLSVILIFKEIGCEMGRPPCCDKDGVKKGPWTPEEDIVLVSYIQENGPGNWRAIPTKTGLMRCSKSCRLRWTNYLRPGIKRGNFTEQEEKLIIHLQALLGNRWAAIASYLPERTDNDIKNYWNTHLKKNRKLDSTETATAADCSKSSTRKASQRRSISKGQWERCLQTDIAMAKRALLEALSMDIDNSPTFDTCSGRIISRPARSTVTYASSTENISRLLEGWKRRSGSITTTTATTTAATSPKLPTGPASAGSSSSSSRRSPSATTTTTSNCMMSSPDEKALPALPPLMMLESWLLDESFGHGDQAENFLEIMSEMMMPTTSVD